MFIAFHLQVIQIVLKTCVGVRVAVCKVVDITILVEAEGKWHDVVLPVFWTTIIVDILVRNPHPGPNTSKFRIISQFLLPLLRIFNNTLRNINIWSCELFWFKDFQEFHNILSVQWLSNMFNKWIASNILVYMKEI